MNREIQVTTRKHRYERCGHVWAAMNKLSGNCRGRNAPYWNKKRVKQT